MFVFLSLCTALQTLGGAFGVSLRPGDSVAISNVLGVGASEGPASPDNSGQQLRTVYSIAQSCLLTIFACVWMSIHPSIDGPRDSGWTCLKRRLVIMLYALIAPEVVFYWALKQRVAAQEIANEYNKEFARPFEKEETAMWGKIVGWFLPLSKDATRCGDGQPWTITHGFFLQMGGFLLYENEYPQEVLDFARLSQLIREKVVSAPAVTENDIVDRSKGDTISKAIVVLQTLWFVVQCIARVAHHLPLSELEVLTLAFAVMNAAIYSAWWDKPQGVGTAIRVSLKSLAEKGVQVGGDSTTTSDHQAHQGTLYYKPAHLPELQRCCSNNSNHPFIPLHAQQIDESIKPRQSWLRRILRKDRNRHGSPFFFALSIPYRVVIFVFRPFNKINSPRRFDAKQLRIPMFYSKDAANNSPRIAMVIVGAIFGAVHLLAWASEFPSLRDRVLWRVSAMTVTMEPLLLSMGMILGDLGAETLATYCAFLMASVVPVYVAARIILIFIALKAILHPPYNVLIDIAWTVYIPHL